MFFNLTREEMESYIQYATHYAEADIGLKYVFYHYTNLMHEDNFIPNSPLQIGLNLTNGCNIYCLHCSRANASTEDATEFMKNWRQIIDSVLDCGVIQIFLTGGEPTLHPEIIEIIKYVKSKKIKMALLTNGLKINESLIDVLQECFTDSYDFVHFSLDALGDEYEKIRIGADFATVDSNLKKLTSKKINVHVVTTVSETNIDQLYDIYRYCVDNNVSGLRFIPIFLRNKSPHVIPSDEKSIKVFSNILKHKKETSSPLKLLSSPNRSVYPFSRWLSKNNSEIKHLFPTDKFVCPATITSCEISPEGYVYPCSYFDHPDFYSGNIFDENIATIWKRASNWTYLRNKEHVSEECSSCEELENCFSGCPAENYYNINLCEVLKEI